MGDSLSEIEAKKIRVFISSVTSLLPKEFTEGLRKPIQLEFIQYSDSDTLPDPCDESRQQEVPLGHAQARSGKIFLSTAIKAEILKGPDSSTLFSCGHRNSYRFAQALLIHELSHLYDHVAPLQKGRVSGDPQFRSLTGWVNRGVLIRNYTQTNKILLRSPDSYEYKSPEETFAVNMEFFLLDPEFQFRRPALHAYLLNAFQAPSSDTGPNLSTTVPVQPNPISGEPLTHRNLDLSRLYEIHYLFAAKGKTFQNKWGHAMLRLVFCNPDRAEQGPKCLTDDLSEHLVVNYNATALDLGFNQLKALTGKYPSQLFFSSFVSILDKYNKDQLRDLVSLPIQMSPNERRLLFFRILEQNWTYQSDYYFFKNNCATEVLNLLKASKTPTRPTDGLTQQTDTPTGGIHDDYCISPLGIIDILDRNGLMDKNSILFKNDHPRDEEKAAADGYFFHSKRKQLENTLAFLKTRGKLLNKWSLEDYLTQALPSQRLAAYTQVLGNSQPQEQRQLAASFFLLETHILRTLKRNLYKQMKNTRARRGAPKTPEFVRFVQIQKDMLPWNIAPKGYGIPTPDELEATLAALKSGLVESERLKQEVLATLRSDPMFNRDDTAVRMEETNTNIRFFSASMNLPKRVFRVSRVSP